MASRWGRVFGKRWRWLGLAVIASLFLGKPRLARATDCVVGPSTYCAAQSCGVWYQPPNNCSQVSQHCVYVDSSDPSDPNYPVSYNDCRKDNTGCHWSTAYDRCEPNPENSSGLCLICNDNTQVCTCTDAYGTPLPCCYYCSDGSGCDSSGGGSPTPTPSAPPACTPTYPEAPTPTSPANGSTVYSTSVTLHWQAPSDWGTGCPSNDNHFLLNVVDYDTGHILTDSEGNPYNRKVIDGAVTSETVPLTGHEGHEIGWRVIASNGSYENQGARMVFNVAATVAGRVYLDADNTCSTAQAWTNGGLTASLRGTSYSDSVGSDGEFGIISPPGTYTLDMTVPSGYICSSGPLGTGCFS